MNQKKIGKFIAQLRKEKDLTQEELANKLGITKNAISKWERGLSMMDISLLNPVCDVLGISIVELLNGERIEQDDIKTKTDDTLKSTIEYSNNRIRQNRIKSIIYTSLMIVILCIGVFFGYKLVLLNKYTFKRPDNVEEIVKGLKNQKEIKIYKRTIPDFEYLTIDNYKIRNDFKDYNLINITGNDEAGKIYTYRSESKNSGISFSTVSSALQLHNAFAASDITFYGSNDFNISPKAFTSADRKFFLLKNDINNDVDFYKYVADNYYKKNNIFMDRRTMMENYAFNVFVSIAVPKVESVTYIKGDYEGYIFKIVTKNDISTYQITIIRDDKAYNIMTNDSRFKDENFMIDLIGTIEIK